MTASFGRAAPGVLAFVLVALPLLGPTVTADAPLDFRPLHGLQGAQAALRLYGCTDALADVEPPKLASRPIDHPPASGMPDGRSDCRGDRLHLGSAFLQSGAEPFYRNALGPRDQIVAAELGYLPMAWYPGPGHPGGISDAVDPQKGLFDRDDDGVLDPAPPDGAPYAEDGTQRPVDHAAPRDNLPDAAPRGSGTDGTDRYFPALEATYRYVWTAGGDRPVDLPAGASFVFPFAGGAHHPGLDGWTMDGRASATYWHPKPFGAGGHADRMGAFHTGPLDLAVGDEAWFLDHGIRVTGFFGTTDAPRVGVEVLYGGPDGEEVLASSLILTPVPGEPDRHATMDRSAETPSNVVFSDRTGIDRNVPAFSTGDPAAPDTAWFALAEGATIADGEVPDRVVLRLGRVVAEQAPLNAFVVDQVLYRIDRLAESDGALQTFALAGIHPLEQPVEALSAGLRLRGLANSAPFPFAPPFAAPHVTLDDLDPAAERDAGGFLQASGGGTTVGTDGLALRPDARTPSERARPAEPLLMQWRTTGLDQRLAVPIVGIRGDTALSFGSLLPARYIELVLSDGTYRVDSALLDDVDSLTGATDAPDSPRGFRSFIFDPQDPSPLFLGEDGLRLFSGTAAHPDAGDRVLFDPVLLRRADHAGRIQTPTALADEVVRLTLAHEALGTLPGLPAPQPASTEGNSIADGTDGAHDNLWDLADDGTHPLPLLEVRYDFGFVDHGTLDALFPPLGPRTALVLPAADGDPARPGLDSFDLDGDGTPDEMFLRGYWDMDRSGTARERLTSSGAFTVDGNASTADLLWLRSRPLTIGLGAEARFFDHGVRFDGSRMRDGSVVPTLALLDHRAVAPSTLATVSDADGTARNCAAVRWDSRVTDGEPCGELQIASPVARVAPTDADVKWWVEVQAVSETAVTVVLNRMVTHVDREATGDERLMFVGGAVYRWEPPSFEDGGVASLAFTQLVPLERAATLTLADGPPTLLAAVPAGGNVPLLPPFGTTHERLQLLDIAVERNEDGFLDGRGDPSDADAVLAKRTARVDTAPGLLVHYEGAGVESRHHFLMLDPTKGWDPERVGTAFVNGLFAAPADGAPGGPHAADTLRTLGAQGFDEALRAVDDRGWDHYARIRVDGDDRVVVDSARLATRALTARVPDHTPGAKEGAHPNDPALWPATVRGAGMWLWHMHAPADLYVIPLDATPVGSPSPTPVGLPDRSPTPSGDWPTRSVDPNGGTEEGTAVEVGGLFALLVAIAFVLQVVRRRH